MIPDDFTSTLPTNLQARLTAAAEALEGHDVDYALAIILDLLAETGTMVPAIREVAG
jgi:hypothetical protein